MAYQIINIGAAPNDGTGDDARIFCGKINANFALTDTNFAALSTTIAGKLGAASPALSGVPTAPTAAPGTNTIQIATTAFVTGALGSYTTTALLTANYAPKVSPAFTGTPTAPNPSPSDNTTKIATMAAVQAAIGSTSPAMPAGSVIGGNYVEYTTNANLTTQVPLDDTIPQSTEGTQILTNTYAAQSATSKLRITFSGECVLSGVGTSIAALFIDAGTDAVRAVGVHSDASGSSRMIGFVYEYTPGDTASHTFAVRAGPSAALNLRFNGGQAARFFGGVAATTMTIQEIKA